MANDCRYGREPASSKTSKIFIIISDKSFFCLLNYHNYFSTIPVAFIVKFWSTSIEMISSDTMKEESLNEYKDELDAIFISVFINRATWN